MHRTLSGSVCETNKGWLRLRDEQMSNQVFLLEFQFYVRDEQPFIIMN